MEKILARKEELPEYWEIQGTTGYDFLNELNALFCQRRNERSFSKFYDRFTGNTQRYDPMLRDKKRLIVQEYMAGDVDGLAYLMKNISSRNRYGSDVTLEGLRRALRELFAWIPLYRTYFDQDHFRDQDRLCVETMIADARRRNPSLDYELDFIRKTMLLDFGYSLSEEETARYALDYYGIPLEVMRGAQAYFTGRADDCAEFLNGFVEAGARHLAVRFSTLHTEPQLQTFAQDVLTRLPR